jgi:hypothetical protein
MSLVASENKDASAPEIKKSRTIKRRRSTKRSVEPCKLAARRKKEN